MTSFLRNDWLSDRSFRGRFRQNRRNPLHDGFAAHLKLELLEERTLLTAVYGPMDVAAAPMNSTLQITGNTVMLSVNKSNGDLEVTQNHTVEDYPANAHSNIVFNGLAGNDKLIVDFDNGNPIPAGGVEFNGGSGTNTIATTDSGDSTLSTTSLAFTSGGKTIGTVSLSKVQLANLSDQASGATFTVQSWTGGNQITLNGGVGNDKMIVDFSNGNPIPAGGVEFFGGAGTNEIDTIKSGDSTLSTTSLAFTNGSKTIGTVKLSQVQIANLSDRASGATFNVQSWAGGNTITLSGGVGNDSYNIGNGNLDSIVANVKIDDAGGATNNVTVNDDLNRNGEIYNLSGSSFATQTFSGNARLFGGITYQEGALHQLTLAASSGADTFYVTPDPTLQYVINANGPPQNSSLNVNFTNAYAPTLTQKGDSGEFKFTNPKRPLGSITYSGIANTNYFPVLAVGSDAGTNSEPNVQIYNLALNSQTPIATLNDVYPATFHGGVRVAVGDVNGDGIPDIITAPGPGNIAPLIKIYNSQTYALEYSFLADGSDYDKEGLQVAVGALSGQSLWEDIVTGPSLGVANVHVFTNTGQTAAPFNSFSSATSTITAFANDPGYIGGVGGLAIDATVDGAHILVGSGVGLPAQVEDYNYSDNTVEPTIMPVFGNTTFTGGVTIAVGNLDNSSAGDDLVIGAGPGGNSQVVVYKGVLTKNSAGMSQRTYEQEMQFAAFTGPGSNAPVQVAIKPTGTFNTSTGNPTAQIVIAQGPNGTSNQIKIYNAQFQSQTPISDPTFTNGENIG